MSRYTLTTVALAAALLAGAVPVHAEDAAPVQRQAQEQVYGSQLMSNQERIEYRAKLRNATSAQEREQIRLDHHQAMQERAQARGLTLPDMAPAMGGGMGQGGGLRGGAGRGGGR